MLPHLRFIVMQTWLIKFEVDLVSIVISSASCKSIFSISIYTESLPRIVIFGIWAQEYLAQLVDRTPRSIMYFENRGQHPSLNTFYQIVTLLDISVDQFFYPDRQNGESDCRQHIDRLLNTMDEKELTVMEATAEGLQKARETEVK